MLSGILGTCCLSTSSTHPFHCRCNQVWTLEDTNSPASERSHCRLLFCWILRIVRTQKFRVQNLANMRLVDLLTLLSNLRHENPQEFERALAERSSCPLIASHNKTVGLYSHALGCFDRSYPKEITYYGSRYSCPANRFSWILMVLGLLMGSGLGLAGTLYSVSLSRVEKPRF